MAEKYVVDVAAPAESEAPAVAEQLAGLLKIDVNKVRSLIRRLPDVVTKPITEQEAELVASRFREAGLSATVRPANGSLPRRAPQQRPAAEPSWNEPGHRFGESPTAAPPAPPSAAEDFASSGAARFDPPTWPPPAAEPAPTPSSAVATEPGAPDPAEPEPSSSPSATAGVPLGADAPVGAAPTDAPAATPPSAGGAAAAQPATKRRPARAVATATPAAAPTTATTFTAPAVADQGEQQRTRKRRRGSLRSKLLSTALVPVLLAIAGALAATWFTARPALYDQLLESARNPAIATAASLSSTLERAGGDGIDHLQLLDTILITRQAFARQNISFILATDPNGVPFSGSFLGGGRFPEESLALQNAVRESAINAVRRGPASRDNRETTHVNASSGERIEIVAQPLMAGEQAIGAVVVGVTDQAVTSQVNAIVTNVLIFSLLPLLLAILIAINRARRLTTNVLTLTRQADEISRGDLENSVTVRSNDELDDLAEALERMRVSMKGALERLRRRRG